MKYYTEEHLWVEVVGETATIGISEFAAEQLNDVVGISLPDEADDIVVAEHLGEIDTGDDQLELIAPITGSVSQVNDLVLEEVQFQALNQEHLYQQINTLVCPEA